ncbi:MAG TPA: dihydrofolate reductase family protein, partial [Rhizomicrobium sp.]|nr:dihydrofolate reductase family protein [Rhizomicrobium sp.]
GPTLAAQAIQASLVDQYHLFVAPFVLGSGNRVLPSNVSIKLELLEERRFADGMVILSYRTLV